MNEGTRGLEGSFQLAVMGGRTVPLDIPPEKFPEKVQATTKPAVETPKATPKKASKPKKRKVKKARVQKAPAKKPVEEEEGFLTRTFKQLVGSDDAKKEAASKSLIQKTSGKKSEPEKKEEGLLTKTFKQLVGDDDAKKDAASKSKMQKMAEEKSEPEKKEEGLLTRTLKSLVGGDKKEEPKTKKKTLNSINAAPTGSTTQEKEEEQPKTAKSETKKTLKNSFEKLIGVGAVSDDGDSQAGKTDSTVGETKSAKKQESGGLLDGILGGSKKKKDSSATKQAKVKDTAEGKSAPAKPKRITARKYVEEEEEGRVKKNYAGAKKGKNVLKESFKSLVTDKKKALKE